MLIRRLLDALSAVLFLSGAAAAELAVSPIPGENHDPRRAARLAYELRTAAKTPPAPLPNGWFTRVEIPPPAEITRLPKPTGDGEYVAISPHYLITSPLRLDDEALHRVVDVMETTFAINRAIASKLPVLRMSRRPTKLMRMHIRLVPTLDDYRKHGGVTGSAGVYQSSRLVFPDNGVAPENQPCTEDTLKRDTVLVSFPALGLNADGSLSEAPVNTQLLVHEGTHQCFIYNNLPIWSNEGWAEYISAAPHLDGFVDFQKGFSLISARARRSASGGRLDCPFSLYGFFTMTRERMYSLGLSSGGFTDTYVFSAMLVAFFLHMDGERGISAMREYLQARVECCPHEQALEKLAAPYGGMTSLQETFVSSWRARHINLNLLPQK